MDYIWYFSIFRRKELTNEKEDYTFAQIGRVISDEWKKVEGEPLEKLKEEAERLNFEGVKKLPKEGGGGSGKNFFLLELICNFGCQ